MNDGFHALAIIYVDAVIPPMYQMHIAFCIAFAFASIVRGDSIILLILSGNLLWMLNCITVTFDCNIENCLLNNACTPLLECCKKHSIQQPRDFTG